LGSVVSMSLWVEEEIRPYVGGVFEPAVQPVIEPECRLLVKLTLRVASAEVPDCPKEARYHVG
jgi:hypothetical protein